METREQKKALLVKDIENMKSGQFEEMVLITFYSLSSYFKSLISFGASSNVTRDNLNVIKEMFEILSTERTLLNVVLKNIDLFNIDSATEVVRTMDELNDRTVEYYYNVIEEIEDAVDMKEERRGMRPRKNFPTLTQSSDYSTLVVALFENRDNIKSFLKFEEEFWNFIKSQEHIIEVPYEEALNVTYVVPITDNEGNVCDIRMILPKVIDLDTALLAIKLYCKAYSLYKRLGKKPNMEDNLYPLLEGVYKANLANKASSVLKLKNVK